MNAGKEIIGQFHEIYNCKHAIINVSNRCQLACRYCFEHDKNGELMSFDTAKKIIDEIALSRKGKEAFISLFGGEPFLNWDVIHKLLQYIDERKYPIDAGATTNLVLLTDDMIKDIIKYDLRLLISIDGTKDVHDRNRSNSFDQVYKNLIRLINSGVPTKNIMARITVYPDVCSQLFDSFKFIWDMGIHRIAPIAVGDTEWSEENLSIYADQHRKIMEFCLDYMNSKEGLYDDEMHIKNASDFISNLMSDGGISSVNCKIDSNLRCSFYTNGDIYTCHQLPYADGIEPLGNIYEGIYTHPNSYHNFTTVRYDLSRCDGCIGKYICKMSCPAQNYRTTNNMNIPDIAVCSIAKIHVTNIMYIHNLLMHMDDVKHPTLIKIKENLLVKYKMDKTFSGNVFSNKNILTDIKDIQDNIIRLKNNKIIMKELEIAFKMHMTWIMNYMRDFIEYANVRAKYE